ncbi:acyl-CoA desaturase [Parachitinimonas caeni]|uniref:Acyl-CoA desaturase n=1 Tax=Parachitinimonas caeni TaxID=3031301 RepID=A0ABT7DS22_9NEIS|nr:acyl-CoA desaturase [Parachitinimonas caeni]MDK2122759.1 acyl-CoA desaturase [Parachitinimonas caeni]
MQDAETLTPAEALRAPGIETPASAPPAEAERPKMKRTVENRQLKRIQHIHTVVMTVAGLGGLISAICLHFLVQPVSAAALGIFGLFFFSVGMGLTIGYHRHFTHRSYKAPTALRVLLGILGSMAGQGPIVFWTALHRMHHEMADKPGDPHSPNLHGEGLVNKVRGIWHAYIGWTVQHEVPNANFYSRDLLADAPIMWVNKRYYLWIALGLALPALLGLALTGTAYGALEGLLWGGLIRMFALHNVIWWITSFAHVFGSRDYQSRDLSTNNFWLALPTLGESWHNNHHAFPRAAILSLHWWQIDISGGVVAILEKLGIVSEVCRVSAEDKQKRQANPSRH